MLATSQFLSRLGKVGPFNKSKEEVISGKGEVSVEDAIKDCTEWLKNAGLDSRAGPIQVSRTTKEGVRNTRLVIWFGVLKYDFGYNIEGRSIEWIDNLDTSIQGKPKPQRPFNLKDPINVKGYVNALAKKLKCPANYELSTYVCKIVEPQPAWLTKDNPSSIKAIYAPRIDKYPVHCTSYQFFLVVDPIDGQPMCVSYGPSKPYDYNKAQCESLV